MDATRRALLGAAALGASGLALMQNAAGAAADDRGNPGGGGYGRASSRRQGRIPRPKRHRGHAELQVLARWQRSENYIGRLGKGIDRTSTPGQQGDRGRSHVP